MAQKNAGQKRAYTRNKQSYDLSGATDPTGQSFELPPFMSYDPSIDAEMRANQRGIEDINQDFRTQRKINRQDYRQTRKDIRQTFQRGRTDLRFGAKQARRGFSEKTADIRKSGQRGREDFRLKLGDTLRKYGIEASRTAQSANARGVGEGGTLAASAAIRAENQARDVGRLELARERQQEDIATALQRVNKDRGEFQTKYGRERKRLRQDTRRDKFLATRDYGRTQRQLIRENQRANREAFFSNLDLTTSAIFDARQRQPGAFSKYGKKKGKKNG